MLQCPKCKQNIEADHIYCPVCGARVREEPNSNENEAFFSNTSQSLETKLANLREKIAEARHNEQIGWRTVAIAVMIVVALAIIHIQIATRNVLFTSSGFGMTNYSFASLGMGLTILAAILVILGVALSIYSRHHRTKLLKELNNIRG